MVTEIANAPRYEVELLSDDVLDDPYQKISERFVSFP
jgi:hypothetical protein